MDWITFTKAEVEADALPNLCLECGAPAACRVSKTFQYEPPWAGWLLLAGIIPGIVAAELCKKQMRVSCPLCENHGRVWRTYPFSLRLGWLLLPVAAGIGFALALSAQDPDAKFLGPFIGGLIGAAVWGIWVAVAFATRMRVKVKRITSEEISFEGVADAFVKAAKDRAAGSTVAASPGTSAGS